MIQQNTGKNSLIVGKIPFCALSKLCSTLCIVKKKSSYSRDKSCDIFRVLPFDPASSDFLFIDWMSMVAVVAVGHSDKSASQLIMAFSKPSQSMTSEMERLQHMHQLSGRRLTVKSCFYSKSGLFLSSSIVFSCRPH